MCGIAGILTFSGRPVEKEQVSRMTDAMAHRGPDAGGHFVEGQVGLGHRRLSILDLSEASNQPFFDQSGRYAMVYNGEIYNFMEVKPLLKDYAFKTTGDTEMLIAAFAKWGVDCIQYFKGMFAFAIWDRQEKELFLFRDRMGVKPVYYYMDADKLLFASEQRGILGEGSVPRKLNQEALAGYFSYQSVGYPYSMIEGISQLEAGSYMRIKNGKAVTKKYWDITERGNAGDMSDESRIKKQIRSLLASSVERRLVSDVPVGAFLSGGIDSSAVVGLMAEVSTAKPNTFNISFSEEEYDESGYAELVARKFNTHHTKIKLEPSVFLDELEDALGAMDIPSGDGVNTYVVSRAIRNAGITVALSGVGGDELFAGYPFFKQYLTLQKGNALYKGTGWLRKPVAALLGGSHSNRNERFSQIVAADAPAIENMYPVFRQMLSAKLIHKLTRLEFSGTALQEQLAGKSSRLQLFPLLSQVSIAEYLGYTQHTLLKDTDQMSMAVSLEVREPFFDHDLVEYVLQVPDRFKNPVYAKSLLVESLKPLLPAEVVHRPKKGFLFPWSVWMKNELKSFCETRINRLSQRPFIQGGQLQQYWQRFLKGDPSVRWGELWLFVVLEYWMEKNNVEA